MFNIRKLAENIFLQKTGLKSMPTKEEAMKLLRNNKEFSDGLKNAINLGIVKEGDDGDLIILDEEKTKSLGAQEILKYFK